MATVSQGTIYGLSCTCHPEDGTRYVGQTTKNLRTRLTGHRSSARFGIKTPVYYWMRKHNPENIRIQAIGSPDPKETLDECEIRYIRRYRETCNLLNILDGGGGRRGYSRPDLSLAMQGSNHFLARLSEENVLSIRFSYQGQRGDVQRLASEFNISIQTIQDILSGKTWTHLPGPRVRPPKRPRLITEEDVRDIRAARDNGALLQELADQYRATIANISMIVNRKTWKHVE